MSEKNKDFYVNNLDSNLYRRGFFSLQKGFIPAYISQFISLALISLMIYLSGRAVMFLAEHFEPGRDGNIPYAFIVSVLGIALLLSFLSLTVKFIADSTGIHSFGKSSLGESGGINSVMYGLKKSLNWILMSAVVVVGSAIYFGIAGLIAYTNFGQAPMIISLIMILVFSIASLILYPVLSLVQPLMILENLHLGQALPRAFKLGFPKYWDTVGVFILSYGMVFTVNIGFIVLCAVFFGSMGFVPTNGGIGYLQTMYSLTHIWVIVSAYVSLLSMIFMINSNLSVSLVNGLIANETSPEEAYDRVSSSL